MFPIFSRRWAVLKLAIPSPAQGVQERLVFNQQLLPLERNVLKCQRSLPACVPGEDEKAPTASRPSQTASSLPRVESWQEKVQFLPLFDIVLIFFFFKKVTQSPRNSWKDTGFRFSSLVGLGCKCSLRMFTFSVA